MAPGKDDAPVVFFETPAAFARWLRRNHQTAKVLWVGFHKKGTGRASITWPESVREALRFGWIDGLRRSIDDESYRIRFTPRRRASNWSDVNIRMAHELIRDGLMESAGLAAFQARSERRSGVYTYEQRGSSAEAEVARAVKRNRTAWSFYAAQAPWYRRTCARWVMSGKRAETRERRLATLIEDCAGGRVIKPLARPGEAARVPAKTRKK